ncbi:MAG: oxygen-independent coproporphyrinogen III oxidase [Bdellovibrionaceae bacterium]|nr:oxygen-independent coproporphyrinogen III oxidase [Pseudobdellovibrionaceae bacterium]MBX3034120.1 oxygen-independent coproporphyrinogen III oxidase [Pseudobdellovibrionaceae bacterium]
MKDLLAKYDVPVPRYTSYPTVPAWEQNLSTEQWLEHVRQSLKDEQSAWSLYLHVPFCETLCTFCGCNNIITKNHKLEHAYVEHLLKEWSLYLQQVPDLRKRRLKHVHLGGGTPTFLSKENLSRLFEVLFRGLQRDEHWEASIEVDPRRTTAGQLETLRGFGFNRISLGVQDFDAEVQRLVNRIQPFDITKGITDEARRLGFDSVNFDLIYGLAKQTPETMKTTAEKTIELRPDRIALYSFALVPWIKPQQRLFKDEDLPMGGEKRELYEIAREAFLKAGYVEIGMDHFALKEDGLAKAMREKTLHRNFMGYTDQRTDLLLALGVSGISETPKSFHQNEKILPKYEQILAENRIPTLKGHAHTDVDRRRRRQILQFATQFETELEDSQLEAADRFLKEMIQDGLVVREGKRLRLTEAGRPFLRNACAFFDERLQAMKPGTQIFSKSI